jgi:hypothetical protein
LRIDGTGAVVNHSGACAWLPYATMRASGTTPRSRAAVAVVTTTAAAPSEIDEDEAAVTVPSLPNAGLSVATFATSIVKGVSSWSIRTSPLRVVTVTGAISPAKSPSLTARCARRTDSIPNASCRSRS